METNNVVRQTHPQYLGHEQYPSSHTKPLVYALIHPLVPSCVHLTRTWHHLEAFETAGFDDAKLSELGEAIDEDKQGEGKKLFEQMVAQVGIKGGSVVLLRRRLFEYAAWKKGGGAGGVAGAGEGGC